MHCKHLVLHKIHPSQDERRLGEREQIIVDMKNYEMVIGRVLYANKALYLIKCVNANAIDERLW